MAGVLLLAAAIRLPLLSVAFERDEGEYAYVGQLLLQGIAPYELADTMKLPGVPAIYAALMSLFGQTHVGIHFGLLLVNAFTALLLFVLGGRLIGKLAGTAAAGFFVVTSTLQSVQGLWANAEHFVLPFALMGILMFLRWLDGGRYQTLIGAGFLLGSAVLMKQHGAAFLLFVGTCLVWELVVSRTGHWSPPLKAVGSLVWGAAIPLVVMGLLVYALGGFDKVLFGATEHSTANSLEEGWLNLVGSGTPFWRQTLPIVLMASVAPLCLDWSPLRRTKSLRIVLFGLFSILAISPGLISGPSNFVLLLPAVALFAGATIGRCYQLLCEVTQSVLARSLPGVLALAMLAITLLSNQDYLFHSSPEQVTRSTYGITPLSESVEIGEWLRENTSPDETIAVIGSEPQIYFYAQRHSATRYIYTFPLMEEHPAAKTLQREMAEEIEAAAPEYLVYVHETSSWDFTKQSSTDIFDWFWDYQQQFQIVGWSEAHPDKSTVHWGRPKSWPPETESYVAVYRRAQASRPGR
ncbi:MAG: hypothetical protein ACI9QQ_001113 [Myxococcota bacterium]|jgi:hypothetical protein